MPLKIKRAAVIGAGVMGAQIAAHLSACGIRCYLLDLPATEDDLPTNPKIRKAIGKNVRNARVLMAMEQLKALKPSPLVSKNALRGIIPGNFEDDWSVLSEADWIIEAVVERLDIKKSIHKRIAEVARADVPVSTNTSGISLSAIASELDEPYRRRLSGVHFFNPPRYMRLVEVIPHDLTDMEQLQALATFVHEKLGKGVVFANDTINFIANRIGVLAIQSAIQHCDELNVSLETADALAGPFCGRPKSGIFRTVDVVGLDVYAHVANNITQNVRNDPMYSMFEVPAWMKDLIAKGSLGQKTGGTGCYRKSKGPDGKRVIEVYRPESGTYTASNPEVPSWFNEVKKSPFFERLEKAFDQKDAASDFLWRIHRDVFLYSAQLVEDIASGHVLALDQAVMWGFNWEVGPFALWQGIGYEKIRKRMIEDGVTLPEWVKEGVQFYSPAPEGKSWRDKDVTTAWNVTDNVGVEVPRAATDFRLPLAGSSKDPRVVASNGAASLVDIGDGVASLTFHSKMNTISEETIAMALQSVVAVDRNFEAMIIANEGAHFSAGANLAGFAAQMASGNFDAIESMIREFQGAMSMIKYANFPVVAAPHGLTLGGGAEVALHADMIMPHFENYVGLVEVGVGLIPAGGGTKELALRAYQTAALGENVDPMPFLQKAFMLIGMAQVSTSGVDAIEMGLYPKHSIATPSRDLQISHAKSTAMHMAKLGYVPPMPVTDLKVVGDPGFQTFKMFLHNMLESGQISAYDAFVGERVAKVLCGGEVDGGSVVTEQYLLELERSVFIELCKQEKTAARIEHMLKKGKPLRN